MKISRRNILAASAAAPMLMAGSPALAANACKTKYPIAQIFALYEDKQGKYDHDSRRLQDAR